MNVSTCAVFCCLHFADNLRIATHVSLVCGLTLFFQIVQTMIVSHLICLETQDVVDRKWLETTGAAEKKRERILRKKKKTQKRELETKHRAVKRTVMIKQMLLSFKASLKEGGSNLPLVG